MWSPDTTFLLLKCAKTHIRHISTLWEKWAGIGELHHLEIPTFTTAAKCQNGKYESVGI